MGNRRSGIAGGRNHPLPPPPQQFRASYTILGSNNSISSTHDLAHNTENASSL